MVIVPSVACTESHGRVPNVDGNAPVISLTIDDWAQLCLWREELREGKPLRYECDAEGNVLPGECPRTDCYTWRWGDCVDATTALVAAIVSTSKTPNSPR